MVKFQKVVLWMIPLLSGLALTCPAEGRFPRFARENTIHRLSLDGWASPSMSFPEIIAPLQARSIQISAKGDAGGEEAFSNAVQYALDNGMDLDFNGPVSTELGATAENRPLRVKAVIINENGLHRQFMVSTGPGHRYAVIGYKTADEGTLFLTSAEGKLIRCMRIFMHAPTQYTPLSEALPDFEKEKAFWIGRLK
jgi:hypothetical protein